MTTPWNDPERDQFMARVRALSSDEVLARQLCDRRHPTLGGRWWLLTSEYRPGFIMELSRWKNLTNVATNRHKGEDRSHPAHVPRDGCGGIGGPDDPDDAKPQGATSAEIKKQNADARRIEREIFGGKGWHWHNGLDWSTD